MNYIFMIVVIHCYKPSLRETQKLCPAPPASSPNGAEVGNSVCAWILSLHLMIPKSCQNSLGWCYTQAYYEGKKEHKSHCCTGVRGVPRRDSCLLRSLVLLWDGFTLPVCFYKGFVRLKLLSSLPLWPTRTFQFWHIVLTLWCTVTYRSLF